MEVCRVSEFLLVLLCILGNGLTTGEEEAEEPEKRLLPGHLKPLGSHMPPKQIHRIDYLPSPVEFHEEFVVPQTPVLLQGALRNSSVWKFWQNDEYLRANFGHEIIDVEQGKKENRSEAGFSLTINEFLDRYRQEDIYMVSDLTDSMYHEWQVPRPLSCGGFVDNFSYTYIWFSSGGTKSVLHTDSYENFHCLVSGRKEFVLMEPHYSTVIGTEHAQKGFYDMDVERVDMTVYPELSRIPWVQAVVHEGDCLYLPYQWIHSVSSFDRNMGVNIWWIQFEFDEGDCPPGSEDLPEYFPLGSVQLSPEMMIIEALGRAARSDDSVLASDLYHLLHESTDMTNIELQHVEELFDTLEPGCAGVITDLKALSREQIRKGYEFMMRLGHPPPPPEEEGEEFYGQYDPLEGYYHPQQDDEFGGTGHDDRDPAHTPDHDHVTEGGGDFDYHKKDEL